MEDQKWLRLVTIGLVLAAIAVGYFLIAQRFSSSKVSQAQPSVLSTTSSTPQPIVSMSPLPSVPQSSQSAFQKVAERNQASVKTLPATGFPYFMSGVFALGLLFAGWGLRKYPN